MASVASKARHHDCAQAKKSMLGRQHASTPILAFGSIPMGRPLMVKPAMTHLDERGEARMVNVSGKAPTHRRAIAVGFLRMQASTRRHLEHGAAKGDALAVARVAGIQAAKRCAELIPLCHTLPLSAVEIDLKEEGEGVRVRATVETTASTGVEMEALTAVSVTLLTLYDMLKALERGMTIGEISLVEKTGGRSGTYERFG